MVIEPLDVRDLGRMAYFADPTGAIFGIWQPKAFDGADVVNVPNSLTWNDVMTRDAGAAKAFYSAVFGWEPGPGPEGSGDEYTVWMNDGKPVGGMLQMGDGFPAEVPPHWGVCFAVADTDATAAKAKELGGAVVNEPTDMAIGRFAGIRDPHGASFAVMQFASNN